MQETDATIMTSLRSKSEVVALCRNLSISSFIEESFSIGVGVRDIGLRLVIIEIRYEVFNGVFREKLLELGAQLRRQSLVVGDDKGRAVDLLDDIRHREGLAGTRYAEESLFVKTEIQSAHQSVDGLLLIVGRLVIAFQFEMIHAFPLLFRFRRAGLLYHKQAFLCNLVFQIARFPAGRKRERNSSSVPLFFGDQRFFFLATQKILSSSSFGGRSFRLP